MSSEENLIIVNDNVDCSHIAQEEIFDKESDNSSTNYLNADCLEVKLEIEGKDVDEFGRLQFVSFDSQVPIECNSVITDHSDITEWNCAQNPFSSPEMQDEQVNSMHVYKQLENVTCDIAKNMFIKQENPEYNCASTIPIIYDSSLSSSWTNEAYISSQYDIYEENIPKKKCKASAVETEKRHQYRRKMKEDNPEMQTEINQLETCKKKDQKREKHLILFEMEKAKALISDCDPSELPNHIARLQALKDKYPDIWLQIENDKNFSDGSYQNNQEKNVSLKMRWRSLTEAEKKRYYRQKIKEENPELWSAIKLKDACKKREQREEKRLIFLEMQKKMQLISHSNAKEAKDHKANLQALKDKYPELWLQLEDAITATEMRSRTFFLDGSGKNRRRLAKPVQMYKDVVEAHKKYLYRQRLKEERPELYAQMRARDTYAKSIRRMMMKTESCAKSGMFSNCYHLINIPETKEYDSSIVLKPLHDTEHI